MLGCRGLIDRCRAGRRHLTWRVRGCHYDGRIRAAPRRRRPRRRWLRSVASRRKNRADIPKVNHPAAWVCAEVNNGPASPATRSPALQEVGGAEEEAQFLFSRFGRVGAVNGIALDIGGEALADGAFGGIGR